MEAGNKVKIESEPISDVENIPQHHQIRMLTWLGEWNIFKRTLKSAALCSGTDSAVKLAEKLAKGYDLYELEESDPILVKRATALSRRLHAQLTLFLINTVGPQQALLESGLEDDEDGVAPLVRLVKHFEYTTKDLRIMELHDKWTHEVLQPAEHPALLYTRLLAMQRRFIAFGENLTLANMCKKFVTSVQERDGKLETVPYTT